MGTLYIVSTPIGNLEDITIRAIKILTTVDIVACEDTRTTGLLLSELRKRYPSLTSPLGTQQQQMLRYDDRFEEQKVPFLIDMLRSGKNIALVSDAGTPLVADPGFKLVREVIRQGIAVISIPGPSALLAALVSSGLPTDSFLFLGYLPEKQSHRMASLKNVRDHHAIASTAILYCPPHKLIRTLEDMKDVFGDIDVVIARELTKIHEDVWHGTLTHAMTRFSSVQGELVIVLPLR